MPYTTPPTTSGNTAFTPTGNIEATTVQGAIAEVDAEKIDQAAGDARYILLTAAGTANGVADLDAGGKVPVAQLPSIALVDAFPVANEAAMLALSAQTGDVAVRADVSRTYILAGSDASAAEDWLELATPTDSVASIFGRSGVVSAAGGDYTAAQITFTPAGNIAAATVQAAIEELDTEKAAATHAHTLADISDAGTAASYDAGDFAAVAHDHDGDYDAIGSAAAIASDLNDHETEATGAHAASAIAFTAGGGIEATTVQTALAELDSDKLATVTTTIPVTFEGQGEALEAGLKATVEIPQGWTNANIVGWTLLAPSEAGDLVLDIWADTFANYPPTIADTITAAAKPELDAAQKATDSTLTGWTKALTAGDILIVNVDSAETITRAIFHLHIQHS